MIRAVLDTNVWVAGLLTPSGIPARICDLALSGLLTAVISPALLREYETVLARPELGLSLADVLEALAYLKMPGTHVIHVDPTELPGVCNDSDDDHFLAAALAGSAAAVVTGNVRHFPPSPWRGILIVTPTTFLRLLSR